MCLAIGRVQFRRVRAVQKETTRHQIEEFNPVRRATTSQSQDHIVEQ